MKKLSFLIMSIILLAQYSANAMFPLHDAIWSNNFEQVQSILETHPSFVNQLYFDESTHQNHLMTPLHFAARTGNEAVARLLLKKGAHINSKDCFGFTPLHFAARNDHGTIVRLLCEEHRVPIEQFDNGKATPLSWAAQMGQPEVVQFLLGKGANCNHQDFQGNTPLHRALFEAQQNHNNRIGTQQGIGVQQRNRDFEETAHPGGVECEVDDKRVAEQEAMVAQIDADYKEKQDRYEAVARILVLHGAALDLENCNHKTPSYWATTKTMQQILRLPAIIRMKNAFTSFCMGQHPRLGATSAVSSLSSVLIQYICQNYLCPEDFPAPAAPVVPVVPKLTLSQQIWNVVPFKKVIFSATTLAAAGYIAWRVWRAVINIK